MSVAIATYCGGATVDELVGRLLEVLRPRLAAVEVVLVDDASPDGSWHEVRRVAERTPEVRALRLASNVGEQAASWFAIAQAHADRIVTLDDDLQHPPDEVPRVLEALEGAELVYGVPEAMAQPGMRPLAAQVAKALAEDLAGLPAGRSISSFRALRGDVVRRATTGGSLPVDVRLARARPDTATVIVRHEPRRAGRSGYTAAALAGHAADLVVGHRLASAPPWALDATAAAVLAGALASARSGGRSPALAAAALGLGGGLLAASQRVRRLLTEPPVAVAERAGEDGLVAP
ncbi:MAG: glycosyltransferase [Acidimicrobiales bacterium]